MPRDKSKTEELFNKASHIGMNITLLALVFSGIAKILLAELSSFKDLFDYQQILHLLPTIIIWIIAVCLLVALVYFFVFLLKRKTANTKGFKDEVVSAFIHALELSSFNPHRLKDTNEQHSPQTKR